MDGAGMVRMSTFCFWKFLFSLLQIWLSYFRCSFACFSNNEETINQVERDAYEHGIQYTCIAIEGLLNPAQENDIVENSTVKQLSKFIAHVKQEPGSEDEKQGSEDEPSWEEHDTVRAEFQALVVGCRSLYCFGNITPESILSIMQTKKALGTEKASSMHRRTITGHFKALSEPTSWHFFEHLVA